MHPQLRQVVDAYQSASERLHGLVDSLPTDRWSERNDPDRWSVGECVVHLNLTSGAFLPLITHVLDDLGPGRAIRERYRQGLVGWFLGKATGPLPRLGSRRLGRVKTAPSFEPTVIPPVTSTMETFDRLQREQVELVGRCDGKPIDRIQIVSPFDARVRYDVYSALVLLPAHQHRHVQQAESVWG